MTDGQVCGHERSCVCVCRSASSATALFSAALIDTREVLRVSYAPFS